MSKEVDVFISYSRQDSDFVRKLNQALRQRDRDTWVDWQDIPLTTKWWQEIEAGIEAANTFVFVISPDSIKSEYCGKEVEHAVTFSKRLIPLVWRDVDAQIWQKTSSRVRNHLTAHQWLFFRDSDEFGAGLEKLLAAIDTDVRYVRNHTRLLMRAREWESHQRHRDFLLRGNQLGKAREWLTHGLSQAKKKPAPASLHLEFINESSKVESQRQRQVMLFWTGLAAALAISGFLVVYSQEQTISNIAALLNHSESQFTSRQQIEAIVASLRAAQEWEQTRLTILPASRERLRSRIASALQQAINWGTPNNFIAAHDGTVYSLSFSPDGQLVASASEDKAVKLWTKGGKLLQTLQHNDSEVTRVLFSPDNQRLAAASLEGTLTIWARDGQLLNKLRAHGDRIINLDFSSDGQYLASASNDGTAKIWRNNGTWLATLPHDCPVASVRFSPDQDEPLLATTDCQGNIKLWQLDGTLRATLVGHQKTVLNLSFSRDRTLLASAGLDGNINLWTTAGKLLKTLDGHDGIIFDVAFSPDSQLLASAGLDGTVKLWQRDGTLAKSLSKHREAVYRIAFSPDGKTLASAGEDRTVKLWRTDGTLLQSLEEHSDGIISIAFSPDGNLLASAGYDQGIVLWQLNQRPVQPFSRPDKVSAARFSPNGQEIALAGKKGLRGEISLWKTDGTLLKLIESDRWIKDVAFAPNGDYLVAASQDHRVHLWQRETLTSPLVPGHQGEVLAVAVSPDSQLIASASRDRTIKLWQPDGSLVATLRGHQGAVERVSFNADGTLLASASEDKTLRLWRKDGSLQQVINHSAPVLSLSFSPDGRWLASGDAQGAIKLWRTDGTLVKTFNNGGLPVRSLSFSPQSNLLAAAGDSTTIDLWQLDGRLLLTLKGHAVAIAQIDFSPDGRALISASDDKTAIIWQLPQAIATAHQLNREEILDEQMGRGCHIVADYLDAQLSETTLQTSSVLGSLESDRQKELQSLAQFCQDHHSQPQK